MKKIIAMVLCLVMMVSLVACSGGGKSSYADAVTVLDTVWEKYDEADKFASIGGDMGNPVDNEPGKFNISVAEDVDATLTFPAAQIGEITEAASLMHMMMPKGMMMRPIHFTRLDRERIISDFWGSRDSLAFCVSLDT